MLAAPMRAELVDLLRLVRDVPGAPRIFLRQDDSYKASLESVHAAFDAFEAMRAARKIVVLGPVESPAGPVGECYREIGRRVGRFADLVLCIGYRIRLTRTVQPVS